MNNKQINKKRVLEQGYNFKITKNQLQPREVITKIKTTISHLALEEADEICYTLANIAAKKRKILQKRRK